MMFSAAELAIISIMRRRPRNWFSTNELSFESKMAWETANKALRSLYQKGYLVLGKKRDRIYWKMYFENV